MFNTIMVPVDLAHLETLETALAVTADMAKHHNATICYVGITAITPGSIARTPEEYEQKLNAFAQTRKEVHGQPVSVKMYASSDPIANLDDLLIKAAKEVHADLVVMATHPPRHLDALIPSHGGKVATHIEASVFLVRPTATKN
jgi:nucleotide-binding universal stress UspA family protein